MFAIGIPELIILLVIVVLLFGPDRIGRGIRGFRERLRGKRQTAIRHESPDDQENKIN